MWIRTTRGLEFIEVEQTSQGFWVPKSKDVNNSPNDNCTTMDVIHD